MSNSVFTNQSVRSLHRDFGYFFIGMILAFAISGIALNHQDQWNPVQYIYESKKIQTDFRLPKESVTLDNINHFSSENKLEDFVQFNCREDSSLLIIYRHNTVTINLINGTGWIDLYRKRPIMAQLHSLHLAFNGDNWFRYYSDIFSFGLIFIGITGLFLMKGKNSFWKRGWLFAIAGIIAPILALFLFS